MAGLMGMRIKLLTFKKIGSKSKIDNITEHITFISMIQCGTHLLGSISESTVCLLALLPLFLLVCITSKFSHTQLSLTENQTWGELQPAEEAGVPVL